MNRFDGLDLDLLPTAAHEAGHAIAASAAGLTVVDIALWHEQGGAAGHVEVTEEPDDLDSESLNGFLVTTVAGQEAQARFLTRYSTFAFVSSARSAIERGCCDDKALFKTVHKRHSEVLSRGEARHQAQRLVTQRWARIERLATRLAKYRRLTSPAA